MDANTAIASNAISTQAEATKSIVVFYTQSLADLETANSYLKEQLTKLSTENARLKDELNRYADVRETPIEVQPEMVPERGRDIPAKRVRRGSANRSEL